MREGKHHLRYLATLTALAAFTSWVEAVERQVPGQYATIQQAIIAAVDGDDVVIAPGTYKGTNNRDLDFLGKAITVRSIDPNNPAIVHATVIDCQGTASDPHQGFYFHSGEGPSSVLSGLTIINGRAQSGAGGIRCASGPTISNCVLRHNSSYAGFGGGLSCSGPAKILNCTISQNSVDTGFGAGVAIIAANSGICELRDCTITGNTGGQGSYGGGLICWYSQVAPLIINCTVSGNSASVGGGLYVEGCAPRVANCLIMGNKAKGDINLSDVGGSGVYLNYSNASLVNSTIVANFCATGDGGGLHCQNSCIATLANCVLWGNSAPLGSQLSIHSSSSASVSYCNIQDGQAGVHAQAGGMLIWLSGNIEVDPVFVSFAGPDLDPTTWQDNDYHLAASSPCVDAGDNGAVPSAVSTDLDGNPRFLDDVGIPDSGSGTPPIVDMGTYEFAGTSSPPPDTDCDGVPDYRDYCPNTVHGITVDTWGCPPLIPGDFDRNGDVGPDDMEYFRLCTGGPSCPIPAFPGCKGADFDQDRDVDMDDFGVVQRCFSGAGRAANADCAG